MMVDQFEVNNLSVGLDYLPKEVSKLVNKNICNGGGGGGTTTTELDPDIKRAILPGIQKVSDMYGTGEFDKVADQEAARKALQTQQDLATKSLSEGLGTQNLLNEMRNTEGSLLAGSQGALGSARGDRAREAALVDRGMQLSQADLNVKQQAADALGNIAGQERQLTQEQLDAPLRGSERYFGMLAGAPQGSKTTQTGGK
jgi:hypothetical protein